MTASRAVLHHAEKRSLLGMGAIVMALHAIGWGTLFLLVLPTLAGSGGNTSVLLGLAVSAYLLGIRHAFDADHIIAIDNTTRRLIGTGRRPVSVGFWFALGHSSVVLVSVILLVLGIHSFGGNLVNDGSALRQITGVWGAAVSGIFLILMGALNLTSLRGLRKALKDIRAGKAQESELDGHLENRGVINKLLRPVARLVDSPWKMFPVGVLFGLGLDTAASIGLFVITGVLTPNLPWYAVFVLPVLFMAGMALFDSADGILMSRVYQWASIDPVRKTGYNLIVTGISVGVAFFVGVIGLAAVVTQVWGSGWAPADALSAVNLNVLGGFLVVFFALVWVFTVPLRRARAPQGTVQMAPTA